MLSNRPISTPLPGKLIASVDGTSAKLTVTTRHDQCPRQGFIRSVLSAIARSVDDKDSIAAVSLHYPTHLPDESEPPLCLPSQRAMLCPAAGHGSRSALGVSVHVPLQMCRAEVQGVLRHRRHTCARHIGGTDASGRNNPGPGGNRHRQAEKDFDVFPIPTSCIDKLNTEIKVSSRSTSRYSNSKSETAET